MINSLYTCLSLVTASILVCTSSLPPNAPLTRDKPKETEPNDDGNLTYQFAFYYRLPPIFFNETRNGCVNEYEYYEIEYFFPRLVHKSDKKTITNPPNLVNPSSVFLEMKNKQNATIGTCNGNLLSARWVLTTAFCLENITRPFSFIAVHAGISDNTNNSSLDSSQTLYSNQFFVNNELGLVKLNQSFVLTSAVNTVNISLNSWNFTSYQNCILSGHELNRVGNQIERVKKTTSFKVTKTCSCPRKLEQDLSWGKSNPWFCSEPVDFSICPDFLGSAIICEGQLLGLAAMDFDVRNMSTCALNVNYFCTTRRDGGTTINVFQSTCHYLRWINYYVDLINKSRIPINCDITDHQKLVRPLSDLVLGFVALNALICAFMLICGRLIFKLYTKTL